MCAAATTASPISGSEVRARTVKLAENSSRLWAEAHIAAALHRHATAWRIRAAERERQRVTIAAAAAAGAADARDTTGAASTAGAKPPPLAGVAETDSERPRSGSPSPDPAHRGMHRGGRDISELMGNFHWAPTDKPRRRRATKG